MEASVDRDVRRSVYSRIEGVSLLAFPSWLLGRSLRQSTQWRRASLPLRADGRRDREPTQGQADAGELDVVDCRPPSGSGHVRGELVVKPAQG
jgi:hypothetical protein